MKHIWNRAKKLTRAIRFLIQHHQVLRRNCRFRNKHLGKRCFILCNGPSVLTQDLLPLQNEIVMTVSNGYLHKDFNRIKPAYHFVPPVTYGMMTARDFVQWFQEMDVKIGEAELFLSSSEYELVKNHSLFPRRNIYYLCSARPFWPNEKKLINICGPTPMITSVPIMCLIVALYMGFKEIYLLGADHDTLIRGEYKYSFEPTVLQGKDFAFDINGKPRISVYDELSSYLELWAQYRHLKRIALANRVGIYNATAGGMLDEYPRVQLDSILNHEKARLEL